jgi:Na+/H+-dicarboxylate symporter
MNSRHSIYLLVLIIIGVFAGLLVGWYFGAAAENVAWLGQLFLNTLSMLVIPLLVSAVISGVTSLGDVRQLGRLSGVTIAYYLITVAIAVLIGLVMVNLIQPGVGVSTEGLQQPDDLMRLAEDHGIGDILLSMVAPNLIRAAADTNLLPLILWSVAFGIALASLGKKGRDAARFFESLNEGMMLMVSWVM